MKHVKKCIVICMTLALLLSCVAIPQKAQAASVTMNKNNATIYVGSAIKLELKNATKKVVWSSSDENIVQVTPSGYAVGIKKGSATVQATYDGITYGCSIKVKGTGLNKTKATLHPTKTLQLRMTGTNPTTWKSSDKTVATVDSNGIVTAVAPGTAKITVSCENANTYTCKVTVKNYKLAVGDTFNFGSYDQDNNEFNGNEPISWTVLDIKDGKALLVADNILDEKQFNPANSDSIHWENSSIRTWLNETFMEEAFNTTEKAQIVESVVAADLSPSYPTQSQGNATKDYVFLLSEQEINDYDCAKCNKSTRFPSQSVYWTRTTSGSIETSYHRYEYTCIYLSVSGGMGRYIKSSNYGIRPALWIQIDK